MNWTAARLNYSTTNDTHSGFTGTDYYGCCEYHKQDTHISTSHKFQSIKQNKKERNIEFKLKK